MTTDDNTYHNKLRNAVKIISMASVFMMLIIGFAVYKAPIGQMLLLASFFVIYVQIPGMLIAKWAGLEKEHTSIFLSSSFALGWCLCIALFFVSNLINTDILLIVTGPVASAAYLLAMYNNRSHGIKKCRKLKWRDLSASTCLFFAMLFLYCMVTTQFRYLSPEISDYVYINPDKAYHMGIINSLTHGYPAQSPWVQGKTMQYHVFTEMLFAIPVRLFGVSTDVVTQSFGPILTASVIALSYYSFFREYSGRQDRIGVYCILLPLSYMYAARRLTSSFAFKILFTNDNYGGYGIAIMLVLLTVLGRWWRSFEQPQSNNNQFRLLAVCTALMMLLTGVKGPIAAVVIGGLWGSLLLGLLLRRLPYKTIIPMVILSAGFLLVYVVILGAKGQVNSPGGAVLALGDITNISFWKKPLVATLSRWGIPKIIRLAVVLTVFAISFFTIYLAPLILGYVREFALTVTGRKEYNFARVTIYAVFLVGVLSMMLLSYSGHSQIYFGLPSLILAPVISFWLIEDLEKEALTNLKKTVVTIMGVTLVFTTVCLGAYYCRKISEAAEFTDSSKTANKYMSMSNAEYRAALWIKNNTEENALLANDRYFSVNPDKYSYDNRWDNRFFLYEVYSNRFSYISGSGFDLSAEDIPLRKEMIENNKMLYDVYNEDRGTIARELGVDYVIVSGRFTGKPNLSNTDYDLCFSNEDVDIYKIRK